MMRLITLALLPVLLFAASLSAQQNYAQTGVASFYADKFQGRTTASGERYDKNKLTCAHLSLPFGTILRVTSLENNRTTMVRVNDRGPFSPDRIVDLSRSAAEALGIVSNGKGKVRIEVVPSDEFVENPDATTPTTVSASAPAPAVKKPSRQPDKTTVTAAPTPSNQAAAGPKQESNAGAFETYRVQVAPLASKGYAVQLASYQGFSNLLRRLASIEVTGLFVNVVGAEQNAIYKLMVGPFGSRAQADREKEKLEKRFPGCFVVQF